MKKTTPDDRELSRIEEIAEVLEKSRREAEDRSAPVFAEADWVWALLLSEPAAGDKQ